MSKEFTCEDCGKGGGSHTLQCPRFGRIASAMASRLKADERKTKSSGKER